MPRPTDAQLFSEASQVFVARVVSTRLRQFPRRQCDEPEEMCTFVEGRYELVETLKGSPARRGKVQDGVLSVGSCSLGLLAGIYYVFYLGPDDKSVLHVNGSFMLGPFYDDRERDYVRRVREYPHQRPGDSPYQ